jgi:DNA-binding XRE family transcriptional regulator
MNVVDTSRRRYATRAEVKALRERLEDVEDALRLGAAEARGRSPDALPAALVERLLKGESPVRIWREHRGMTASALAAAADVDAAYLSQIETGKKPGSVKALRALAGALHLDLDDLAPRGVR